MLILPNSEVLQNWIGGLPKTCERAPISQELERPWIIMHGLNWTISPGVENACDGKPFSGQ